jgi:phenylacetate-CoA ligase
MTEVGCVTYEAESRPGALCPLEEDFIVEVIEADPAKGSDGAGELVLTNLGRLGSPLIRYRTGDQVRPQAEYSEARTDGLAHSMVFDGGILGRADDMFFIRGNNVYPTAIESVIREFREVAEYRLRVVESGDLNSLEVDIEPGDVVGKEDIASGEDLAERIATALHDALLFRVKVHLVDRGTLPRPELKAKRLVREKDTKK